LGIGLLVLFTKSENHPEMSGFQGAKDIKKNVTAGLNALGAPSVTVLCTF
jgi:hypothetical protein